MISVCADNCNPNAHEITNSDWMPPATLNIHTFWKGGVTWTGIECCEKGVPAPSTSSYPKRPFSLSTWNPTTYLLAGPVSPSGFHTIGIVVNIFSNLAPSLLKFTNFTCASSCRWSFIRNPFNARSFSARILCRIEALVLWGGIWRKRQFLPMISCWGYPVNRSKYSEQ